jgi:hypothetical protein
MSNGKGSARRPASVSESDVSERWAQTFGNDRASGEAMRDKLVLPDRPAGDNRVPPLAPPPDSP